MNLQKGILWNTRDNTLYEIEVPDRKAFLDAVTKTVTKGAIESYYDPGLSEKKAEGHMTDQFAVIDTETNWNDEVMSIGVVVADSKTKRKSDSVYYIIDPEYRVGWMYADELQIMQLLGHEIRKYNVAPISDRKITFVEPRKSNVTFFRGITNNKKEKGI